jgi:signal transduction histidine kinase
LLTKNEEIRNLEIKKQGILQKSLLAGMALMLILFFFIYRNYHTRQLLKLQTLRNKIASDLHDDIGSTLSSISIFTLMAREGSKEVTPMLDQIGEYSRNMLESMADIVWTIHTDNDNFEKIILRMRSFAFELLGAKNIDFEFNADESLSTLKLPMELRKNLYLIFKEATNNIVKYSHADSAIFSLTRSKNILTLLIRDNGKGFDITQETVGNGLKNMKNRAMEMGATFLIESEPGRGTTIQLLIKAA